MGNIEIKERPKRSHSIFKPRIQSKSRSPFKQIINSHSPYYHNLSPIRFSNDTRSPKKSSIKEDSREVSTRFQERQNFISPKAQMGGLRVKEVEVSQNREKCHDIIKKVRNFNDFLVELKKKLRSDGNWKGGQENQRGQVNMSVKLQNQRVQLQKYKKLVKRQLSKTHSISSINIQDLKNGQKMLTIQYENLTSSQKQLPTTNKQQLVLPRSARILESHLPPCIQQTQKSAPDLQQTQAAAQRVDYHLEMEKIKTMFKQLKTHCHVLGNSLAQQEQQQEDITSYDFLERCKQKTARIDQLFREVESTNIQSLELQKQVRRCLL